MRSDSVGFSLIELLIVVAIILIIAAIAIPNLLHSRMAANQASAVGTLRAINAAEITYASIYNAGYSSTLAQLGPPPGGGAATSAAAGLVDSLVASGSKSGYTFVYTPVQGTSGTVVSYSVTASPISPGQTGQTYYYTDPSTVIRQNNSTVATASDSPIGG
jgi:type IV pilus assembly protein PilA